MPNVAKAVENAINWMKEHWTELPGKVAEIAISIKDKFLSVDWLEVGKQIVSSLWEGMKSIFDKIVSGVGEYVGKIKDALVGSAQASTGGSATSMSGATGGGGYTAAADRMRRMSVPATSAGARAMIGHRLAGRAIGMGSGADIKGVVDAAAARHGVNPRITYGIIAGESLHGNRYDIGDRGGSFSMFQMYTRGRLGNDFQRRTGLSVRDPKNIPHIANYVARHIAAGGSLRHWRGYHGPRNWNPSWGSMGYSPGLAKRARGGPVDAGQSYVVGEQGWEIFKPRQSGEIMNQKQLAAGGGKAHGGTVNFHSTFHINGAQDPQQVANQVERHIRNKLGSIFRGSHSDIGFAPV